MAMITMHSLPAEPTEKELHELEMAERMPWVFDEDCPEMTEEMLKQFHRTDSVSIRVSAESMAKVKALGQNPQKVLSRLVELAINDSDMLRMCV